MDHKRRSTFEAASSMDDPARNLNPDQLFSDIGGGKLCFGSTTEQFPKFSPPMNSLSFQSYLAEQLAAKPDQAAPYVDNNQAAEWDPRVMLSNLSFLEQKIHQVQDIIRSMINDEGQLSIQLDDLAAKQQLVTADLTCIIIQLISTAGTLLPSIKSTVLPGFPPPGQLGGAIGSSSSLGLNGALQQNEVFISEETKASEYEELIKTCEGLDPVPTEDHEMKDSEDGVDGENLPPGSYEVLQLEKEEILAPHTHFCSICGKGFKRDANLRMHMRGHGDEYKSPAALAKPTREPCSQPVLIKRYSCPFLGCKRNKEHKKFLPLKTILCVKNHYKRSHCDKSYTCSRCNTKKFSVMADLKTHEKHCGRDKWLCSCGTTFSRKDKLFGHVALFQGHTPALPTDEGKSSVTIDQGRNSGATTAKIGTNFTRNIADNAEVLGFKGVDDDRGYFSQFNFDSYNFGGLDDFSRAAFDASDGSFSILPSGSGNFVQKSAQGSNQTLLG